MRYKLIIWDFNGTVLDDTEISMKAINTVMARRNMKLLYEKEELQRAFCFPVENYYRNLGFDFSREPFSVPADEWVEEYAHLRHLAVPIEGIEDGLLRIKEAGLMQIILSASETGLLISQLSELGLTSYFDEVLGTGDFYASGKEDIAKKWIETNNREEIFPAVMIGDTEHDLECAKAMGCDCILYSGGFQTREKLCTLGVKVCDSIKEIVDIILEK